MNAPAEHRARTQVVLASWHAKAWDFDTAKSIFDLAAQLDVSLGISERSVLASAYFAAGRTNDAIELEEQVLADSVEVFGDKHPNTLRIRGNLAGSYRQGGRTNQAIELQEQVLADSVEILGDKHPNTLTARANLAVSYQQAGRTNDAITLLTEAVEAMAGVLGADHPDSVGWSTLLDSWRREPD